MSDKLICSDGPICPVEKAMSVIGGKWKLVILFHLSYGEKRYSELKKLMADASDRMLTRSLKELESNHMLKRQVLANAPVRVEYSLTDCAPEKPNNALRHSKFIMV